MDLEAGKSEILKEVGEGMCTHDHMRLQNEISRGLLLFLEDFLPVCWFNFLTVTSVAQCFRNLLV